MTNDKGAFVVEGSIFFKFITSPIISKQKDSDVLDFAKHCSGNIMVATLCEVRLW
jgi:hypothetical protein